MSDIIVKYVCENQFLINGGSSGWSFEISNDGSVVIKKYVCTKEESYSVKSSKTFYLPDIVVNKLSVYLKSKQLLINALPNNISNESMDGMLDTFYFFNKKFSCANIKQYTKEEFDIIDSKINWLEEVRKSKNAKKVGKNLLDFRKEYMIEENKVLDIFEGIADILQPYGLKVKSWNDFSCEWDIISLNH